MRRFAVAMAGALALSPPAFAQQAVPWPPRPQAPQDPGAIAGAAIDELIRALGLALQSLPQYGIPRINERGDIVIPRLDRPPGTRRPPAHPDEYET